MQSKINVFIFASMLLVIAKALFAHVRLGSHIIIKLLRHSLHIYNNKSSVPLVAFLTRKLFLSLTDVKSLDEAYGMEIIGLSPYWFDVAEGSAVHDTVAMQSLFLLTGPNGGGKSSLLPSICAAALLGICGFMVPAESALIPQYDSIMLHMKSYDSPEDGKSSFQVEMSEIQSIISATTKRSLVLIDEICRGTETAKGTRIAGSIIETLDKIGCLGVVSTHLHGLFTLPLNTKNTVYKATGTVSIDGKTKPTLKLIDGICRESLAFETAKKEGISESIIQRAESLYLSAYAKEVVSAKNDSELVEVCSNMSINGSDESHLQSRRIREGVAHNWTGSINQTEFLQKEVESAVTVICQKKLIELYKKKNISELAEVHCVLIGARERPPPSTIGASSVYVMLRPEKKLYVGETDDLEGRVSAHLPVKSLACQLETLLINQLPNQGFRLANVADGKHRNFGTSISIESAPFCS
ncbi:dna mismatch repair protein msh1 [Quercus suber]|uniref:Dna mismatch repair protein msh1 n=1 Tax=Quercus suber TaxID=58331 RepID=A0AAW0IP63_QUESU